MKQTYIYQTGPIDFFFGMQPLSEAMKTPYWPQEAIIQLIVGCFYSVAKAEGSHWEGDIRWGDIYLFGLPDPDTHGSRLGVVWKQDNNGTTFTCSPVELPWLADWQLPCKG
jgi:hypothetical protein